MSLIKPSHYLLMDHVGLHQASALTLSAFADRHNTLTGKFAIIPLSGLPGYIIFWIALLYPCLLCNVIPTSGFSKIDLKHLYLLLVRNIIPKSVMVTSAFVNFAI